jgi:hypothetical protein
MAVFKPHFRGRSPSQGRVSGLPLMRMAAEVIKRTLIISKRLKFRVAMEAAAYSKGVGLLTIKI